MKIDNQTMYCKKVNKRNDLFTISIVGDFDNTINEKALVKKIIECTESFIIKSGVIEIFQEEKEYIILMHYDLCNDKWDIKKERY